MSDNGKMPESLRIRLEIWGWIVYVLTHWVTWLIFFAIGFWWWPTWLIMGFLILGLVQFEYLPQHEYPVIGTVVGGVSLGLFETFLAVTLQPLIAAIGIAVLVILTIGYLFRAHTFIGFERFLTEVITFTLATIIAFAVIYARSGILVAGAISNDWVDAIYFSTITWATAGDGNFIPTGRLRLVVGLEILAGYVAMAAFIGLLFESKNHVDEKELREREERKRFHMAAAQEENTPFSS